MALSAQALTLRRKQLWWRLQPALTRTPALAAYQGLSLAEYPITEPTDLRANYGDWNSLNRSESDLRILADAAETGAVVGDLSAGWSTGSGAGKRGLFLANAAERDDYLGQSLARLLPASALLKRQRLALHLRANNALYSDVKNGRFAFAHFPLERTSAETAAALSAYQPTILIAPPHRLLDFAKAGLRLPSLRHLFCGSEPISPAETASLTEVFGVRPRAIYQATEGFLGAECREGRLHLNEHGIEFELEPVDGTNGFRPIITDLRRTSQPIIRLRLDDFLVPDAQPCPCGYTGRVIHAPQGRVGDIWRFGSRIVTPPKTVATVEGVLGGMRRWQAIGMRDEVLLRLAPDISDTLASDASHALSVLAGVPIKLTHDLSDWTEPKRRKVMRSSD